MPTVKGKLDCLHGQEGSSTVEVALASLVFLAMLIGSFEALLGLYTYNFVSEAAREASRYAAVRGSTSCTNTPNLTNCNATSDKIQTWVKSRGYPGIKTSNLTVTATWNTVSASTPATWSTCTTGTCNAPGNMVKVVATYAYPLHVPFAPTLSINLTSTSRMVISQ